MNDHDSAETGGILSAGYLLPVLQTLHLLCSGSAAHLPTPHSVVLVPTPDLAHQVNTPTLYHVKLIISSTSRCLMSSTV